MNHVRDDQNPIIVSRKLLEEIMLLRELAGQYPQLFEVGQARNSLANALAMCLHRFDQELQSSEITEPEQG